MDSKTLTKKWADNITNVIDKYKVSLAFNIKPRRVKIYFIKSMLKKNDEQRDFYSLASYFSLSFSFHFLRNYIIKYYIIYYNIII